MEMEKREMVGMAFLQPAPLLRDVRFQAGATLKRCMYGLPPYFKTKEPLR